jgi:hypothetical protein
MTNSNEGSPAPDKADAGSDCDGCDSDQAGCMGSLLLMAVGAAPASFIAGVAGCIAAVHSKGGGTFVPILLMLVCWLSGGIGIAFALMNFALRDRRLAKYLPLALCIAAPTIPSVWFCCTGRALL